MQNRLDEAIEKLQMALTLWPGYPEAKELLEQAQARRGQAQEYYDKAAVLAKAGKWDDAIAAVNAATGFYPGLRGAKDLLADIKRRAAEAHAASAAAVAAGGDLPAAREGLARVAAAWSDDLAAKGRWGAALVWAVEAADLAPDKPAYADRLRAARQRVIDRVRFSLGPEPEAGAMPSPATADLRAALWRRLAETRPEFLTVTGAAAPGAAADYAASAEVTALDVRSGVARTENRTQRYTVSREEPNPAHATLRNQLDSATITLQQMRSEYNTPCMYCGGRGWFICRACGGTGVAPGSMPPAPCPLCSIWPARPGWQRCSRCGGDGRAGNVSIIDLRRQEAEVARLQDALARTPAVIVKQVPADWPYTIEFHEKTGSLEAALRVVDGRTGRVVRSDALRRTRRAEDTGVQNANPGIGLAAKSPKLPDDETVRRGLVDEAAAEAAGRVLAAAVAARAAARQAESDRLLADGKVAEAVEAGAEAAILREAVEPGPARLLMHALRDRLRAERRAAGAPAPAPTVPKTPI
jgi:hypothetical protein